MELKKILLATHNKAKFEELKRYSFMLIDRGVELLGLDDVEVTDDAYEEGSAFGEIALKKAQFYAELAHLPVLTDDGGLTINALNGEPGVKSKRWMGREATDEELMNYALTKMQGKKGEDRAAQLRTCLCFYDPRTEDGFCEEGIIDGYISEQALDRSHLTPGYPYRGIFTVKKFNKYYDDLTEEEHEQTNHRRDALRKVIKRLYTMYEI